MINSAAVLHCVTLHFFLSIKFHLIIRRVLINFLPVHLFSLIHGASDNLQSCFPCKHLLGRYQEEWWSIKLTPWKLLAPTQNYLPLPCLLATGLRPVACLCIASAWQRSKPQHFLVAWEEHLTRTSLQPKSSTYGTGLLYQTFREFAERTSNEQ